MEIKEVGNNFKSLTKNKFFLIALLAVIGLAFYQIIKSGGGSTYSSGGLTTPTGVSQYPTVETDANTVIESINSQNKIYRDEVTEEIRSLGSYFDQVKADLMDSSNKQYENMFYEFGKHTDSIQQSINNGFSDVNSYMKDSFAQIGNMQQTLHQSTLDTINTGLSNIGNKIDSSTSTIYDKIQTGIDKSDNNFSHIADKIDIGNEGIKDKITSTGNTIIDKQNYLSDRQAYLSQMVNDVGDKIYNEVRKK